MGIAIFQKPNSSSVSILLMVQKSYTTWDGKKPLKHSGINLTTNLNWYAEFLNHQQYSYPTSRADATFFGIPQRWRPPSIPKNVTSSPWFWLRQDIFGWEKAEKAWLQWMFLFFEIFENFGPNLQAEPQTPRLLCQTRSLSRPTKNGVGHGWFPSSGSGTTGPFLWLEQILFFFALWQKSWRWQNDKHLPPRLRNSHQAAVVIGIMGIFSPNCLEKIRFRNYLVKL